jgi:hypothetical protein
LDILFIILVKIVFKKLIKMPAYSLIELKLRRYFYLGHEYCIYVPPAIRTSFSDPKHHDDVTGVRIIGKIVKKNKPEEINSIVPIILKVS